MCGGCRPLRHHDGAWLSLRLPSPPFPCVPARTSPPLPGSLPAVVLPSIMALPATPPCPAAAGRANTGVPSCNAPLPGGARDLPCPRPRPPLPALPQTSSSVVGFVFCANRRSSMPGSTKNWRGARCAACWCTQRATATRAPPACRSSTACCATRTPGACRCRWGGAAPRGGKLLGGAPEPRASLAETLLCLCPPRLAHPRALSVASGNPHCSKAVPERAHPCTAAPPTPRPHPVQLALAHRHRCPS